ncbi:MAG: DUF922 domain-containing protein [Minicystis sp.]
MSAPGVRITERRREYPVTGSTSAQIRDVIALLGPRRDGRAYVASTEWEVRWSYRRAQETAGFVAQTVTVEVDVVMVLPRWRPPPNAAAALIADWDREMAAVMAHEEGHRDLAITAGHAVAQAIESIAPQPSAAALDEAVSTRAREVLAEARAREVAYDDETAHGLERG